MAKVTDTVAALARPIVEEKGCSLWDVEYVKEAVSAPVHRQGRRREYRRL